MPSKICRFVQRGGLVCFFWGSNGSISFHSWSVKLLEYGIAQGTAFLCDLSLSSKIPNGFYRYRVKMRSPLLPKNIPSLLKSIFRSASLILLLSCWFSQNVVMERKDRANCKYRVERQGDRIKNWQRTGELSRQNPACQKIAKNTTLN